MRYFYLIIVLVLTLSIFTEIVRSDNSNYLRKATQDEIESILIPGSIGYFVQRDIKKQPVTIQIYGEIHKTVFMIPIVGHGRNRMIYYNNIFLDNYIHTLYDYLKGCESTLWTHPDCPKSHIKIMNYKTSDHIKQDILTFKLEFLWKIQNNKNPNYNLSVKKLDKNRVVLISKENSDIYWQSNDNLVHISYIDMKIEDDPQFISAYLEKYPATWEISMSDFDPEKILRSEVDRYLGIIQEQEENRESDDKITVYRAMNYQCEFEADIRCWTGETTKGCPITMEMDHEKRRNQWKDFSEKANTRPVNTKKYHSLEMFVPECQDNKAYLKIADKIGLSYENIPPEYTMYRRE